MRFLRSFFAALLFVTPPAGLFAGEEKVALDKLPRPVVDAVKKRFPKAELTSASKETENGKTEYEIAIVDGNTKIDVELTPEGAIKAIEKQITVDVLPKAVRAALDKAYEKGTYTKVEEITKVQEGKETLDCYEVVVERAGQKKVEVQVTPDGKFKKEEKK